MNTTIPEPLIEMGASLTELAVKGTASIISKKIQAAKSIKDTETLRTLYDGLMNEVLQEREEAIRIAQAYKFELERIVISDEDINHLHTTITNILNLTKTISPDNKSIAIMELLQNLINVDTLKTMQLLGFNYKAAIGEPLTQICAEAIINLGKSKTNLNTKKNK